MQIPAESWRKCRKMRARPGLVLNGGAGASIGRNENKGNGRKRDMIRKLAALCVIGLGLFPTTGAVA